MSNNPADLNFHPNGVVFLPTSIGEVILLLPDAEGSAPFTIKAEWTDDYTKILKVEIDFHDKNG